MTEQTIIYIDGYWKDNKELFPYLYKCIIGEWDGAEDDTTIFYYFKDVKDAQHDNHEFVITNVFDENLVEISRGEL